MNPMVSGQETCPACGEKFTYVYHVLKVHQVYVVNEYGEEPAHEDNVDDWYECPECGERLYG